MHRLGDEVRVFTRNLADVTERVPEIVDAIRALPLEAAMLDAEAIALRPDRRPAPVPVTMSRFGSREPSRTLAAPTRFRCRRSSSTASTSTART